MNSPVIDNRYRIIRVLGEGAMGKVWLVEDETTRRQVALKVVSNSGSQADKSLLQLKQEFRLMTQLRHPNCCQVFDYGETSGGEPYFTMEVVPGRGLDELLPMDEATFRDVFAQLLLALGYIHQLGMVHGDLKSANVRLRPDGTVKLMDFGLMDYAGRAGGPIRGTPAYMAPEVIRRSPLDLRSDLYSAGCLAYELLTGVLPFGGTQATVSATQLLRQHVADKPLPMDTYKTDLSKNLIDLVMRLLEKEPIDRYQSAFKVLEAMGAEVPAGIGGKLLGSPLIGRKFALTKLGQALGALREQRIDSGGALLVLGPAGIGKSRLLEEFRFTAQLEGVSCHVGGCMEQGSPPFGAFLGVLRSVLPILRELLPDDLAAFSPVLTKLIPELNVEPAPDMESPKNEMMRLHSVIAHLLIELAARRPFVILIENWQWTDLLSAELMEYLLRNLGDAPILFVISMRDAPLEGRALARAERIELPPLSKDDLHRMIISMLGTPEVGAAFVARIDEFSEGNPFMVERLLEHLVQTDVLVNQHGKWNTETALSGYQLPAGLQTLLARKFDTLSAAAQTVTNLAAVVGKSVDLDFLVELTQLEENTLFDAVDEVQHHQVLHQEDDGALVFTQDALRELIYARLDADERIRLHHAVAVALEKRIVGDPESAPLEEVIAIAHHLLAGRGDVGRSLLYSQIAGERARRLYSLGEAERLVSSGLALLENQPEDAFLEMRLHLSVTLGEIKRMTGRAKEGKELLEPALALAERLERRPRGGLITSLGKCYQVLQDFEQAVATYQRACETCEAEQDPRGASRARLANSRVYVFTGDPQRAIAEADEGVRFANESHEDTQRGVALAWLGYLTVTHAPQRLDEGVKNLQDALDLLRQTGDQLGLATTYNLLGNAQLVLGDLAAARETFLSNRRICYEIDLREEEAFAFINLAIVELDQANYPAALGWIRLAQERVRPVNAKFPLALSISLEAEALSFQGDEARARRLADEGLAMARELKNRYLEGLVLIHQCESLIWLGRTVEAQANATQLSELITATGSRELETRLYLAQAEILLRSDERAAARDCAERGYAAAKEKRARGLEVRAKKALARVALSEGDYSAALGRCKMALEEERAIGMRLVRAELLMTAGEASLALGNGEAIGYFDALADVAQEIALPPLLAIARFGQAASRPYDRGAGLAVEAKEILEAWTDRMSPGGQEAFLRYHERKRVIEGNYIGFSLPMRNRPTARETGPLSLRPGFRSTGDI